MSTVSIRNYMFRLPFGFTLNPRGSSIESGYSKFLSNLLVSKLGKVARRCFTGYRSEREERGVESQGKDRTRFIDWSSLRRENPSNRKRKDSLDGFLLSSFLRIFHFEFPAKRYVEPRRLKKRNRLESKRDSLAARAGEKGRSGMEKGGKSKRRKRGRGRSERRVTGGLSILRTVVKVRRV